MEDIKFDKGALTFWIPEGTMNYKDNKFINLINYISDEGTLCIVKDKDNGLRVSYNYFDNGACEVKASAEELDNEDKHMVAVTWSISEGKIKIFIDGDERASEDIELN